MAEQTPEAIPPAGEEPAGASQDRRQRWIIAGIAALALVILAGIVAAIVLMIKNPEAAANWRDIFIVFMAVESLIVGVALIILILQVASLINLLQNEVRPILESTSEAVNTLRGTTEFLGESLVEPVIKLNSSLAGLRRFFEMFGLGKK